MGRERKVNMIIDPERFLKLPKWAQDDIANKGRTITRLVDRILELSEPELIQDTDTVVHEYAHPDQRLPKGSIIRFDVNGGEVDVRVNDGTLEIRSNTGMLSIAPRVSNVVEVTVRDR